MVNAPSVRIASLEISPPLALAPMVGLSHSALRSVIGELGGAGLYYTEMLSAKILPHENEKISPWLIKSSSERPLFYQIFLSNPTDLVPAIEKLTQIGADGIDINLGCPAPRLRKNGAGCALLSKPAELKKIISTLRKNTDLPISAKIRLGEDLNESRYLELCSIIEGEGADCLNIHARLNHEKFCRKPRWQWIAKAKNNIRIPIFANGGIFSVKDAERCLEISGADGLMIGRGAAEAPWIFAEIASSIYGVAQKEKKESMADIYFSFAKHLRERFSKERRLGRLKQFTHYFARSYAYGHQLASTVQISSSMEEALDHATLFFMKHEQQSF